MTRLEKLREFSRRGYWGVFQTESGISPEERLPQRGISLAMRMAQDFQRLCALERPMVLPEERIAFLHTLKEIPVCHGREAFAQVLGLQPGESCRPVQGICMDYGSILQEGLESRLERIAKRAGTAEEREDDEAMALCGTAILVLAERYADEAERMGNMEVAGILQRIPRNPAQTFHEAMQGVRFLSSMLLLAGHGGSGMGRLDQYLYPYYCRDIDRQVISEEMARELLEEFLLAISRDMAVSLGGHRAPAVSLVLGGSTPDGASAVNALTYQILGMISQWKLRAWKIALRIDRNTPQDLLETAAHCSTLHCLNDEAAIPALEQSGYSLEQARDYAWSDRQGITMAGKLPAAFCEGTVSFSDAAENAVRRMSGLGGTVLDLEDAVQMEIHHQVQQLLVFRKRRFLPSPLLSLFLDESAGAKKKRIEQRIAIYGKDMDVAAAVLAEAGRALEAGRTELRRPALTRRADGLGESGMRTICRAWESHHQPGSTAKLMAFLMSCLSDACESFSTFYESICPGYAEIPIRKRARDEIIHAMQYLADAGCLGDMGGGEISLSCRSPEERALVVRDFVRMGFLHMAMREGMPRNWRRTLGMRKKKGEGELGIGFA